MRMRVCWPSWSWTVLYLVIDIENLLQQFQLFYLHLWPIYWLSFVNFM
jgi:hypothetical protein